MVCVFVVCGGGAGCVEIGHQPGILNIANISRGRFERGLPASEGGGEEDCICCGE